MKQSLWAGIAGLSCLVLAASPVCARAMMIAPPPLSQRTALADAVVVGKVTGFGEKLVSAVPPGGGDKVDYQIAIVQVGDAAAGLKDAKEIKVGFLPPPPTPPQPGPGPVLIRKRYPQFTLTQDQEACLFLVKHPTGDFYIGVNYYDIIDKKTPDFDKSLDEIKRCAKLLADATASLKGKNNDDRFLTASMLIARYRTAKPGQTKTEPIDAEQSKLILQALADADWNPKPPQPGVFMGFQMTPQVAFFRLNLTPQDGWMLPKDPKDIPDAAKQWLKDNVEKYPIQRFVADKKDK
ncbi:MAG TPA: hypothetical protein VMS17_02855 [Gemmataceae bacterium]|nr:hypothetical protein [Gemmataceae bacterium]